MHLEPAAPRRSVGARKVSHSLVASELEAPIAPRLLLPKGRDVSPV